MAGRPQARRQACLWYRRLALDLFIRVVRGAGVNLQPFSFTGSFFDHYRDYRNLPDMSEDDAMVAVLEALNREGVTAWDGDATGIVVQLIMAQYKARKQAEEKLMQIREILEKQHEIFPFLK